MIILFGYMFDDPSKDALDKIHKDFAYEYAPKWILLCLLLGHYPLDLIKYGIRMFDIREKLLLLERSWKTPLCEVPILHLTGRSECEGILISEWLVSHLDIKLEYFQSHLCVRARSQLVNSPMGSFYANMTPS